MLKTVVNQLWESGKLNPLPASQADVRELISRIFKREPPSPILEYYRLVPGGMVGGIPLYGVNFTQEGFNLLAGFKLHEQRIAAGYWPIANDGCGNLYCCVALDDTNFPVGFVEVAVDEIVPQWIVASSIEALLTGIVSAEFDGAEWPYGDMAEEQDPGRRVLDERFQRIRLVGG
jgi:hypothetical protein